MLNARNAESKSAGGVIIFKSPPSNIPSFSTTEATEISSAVSPDAGTITSLPLLNTELGFSSAKVSTLDMTVSYFVYNLPYKIIGVPSSCKSDLE